MAMLVNTAPFRKRGARVAKPSDFHPFYRKGNRARVSVEQLSREMTRMADAKRRKG